MGNYFSGTTSWEITASALTISHIPEAVLSGASRRSFGVLPRPDPSPLGPSGEPGTSARQRAWHRHDRQVALARARSSQRVPSVHVTPHSQRDAERARRSLSTETIATTCRRRGGSGAGDAEGGDLLVSAGGGQVPLADGALEEHGGARMSSAPAGRGQRGGGLQRQDPRSERSAAPL